MILLRRTATFCTSKTEKNSPFCQVCFLYIYIIIICWR